MHKRLPWRDQLRIIDNVMKAISGVSDPQELVDVYWNGIGELIPLLDYVALSRRHTTPPYYHITRATRFTEEFNPWTQRHRLPRLSGGLLGDLLYANEPAFVEDLPARLAADDPARFYLDGYDRLVALPQYDNGEALNMSVMLLPVGFEAEPEMIPMLHWQAGLFGRGTQNLVLRNDLAKALDALDDELRVVGDIQRSLLPQTLPAIDGFELSAFYRTSARAGGDYYDFFPLDQGAWGLFIADVSGHGTPAAVLMAITHAIAHARPGTHKPPGALLEYLNDQLTRTYTRNGTFVTAFYAVLDPATRKLTYSAAGHNPPRLLRDGRVRSLDAVGAFPLGIETGQNYTQTSVTLERGDLLLLYTDGITEAMSPGTAMSHRELFGVERLDELLSGSSSASAEACVDAVRTAVAAFAEHAPPTDDQTLIAIRCR